MHECIWRSLDCTQKSRFIMYKFQRLDSRFNTSGSMQVLEAELDEHKKTTIMFQHAAEYNE